MGAVGDLSVFDSMQHQNMLVLHDLEKKSCIIHSHAMFSTQLLGVGTDHLYHLNNIGPTSALLPVN